MKKVKEKNVEYHNLQLFIVEAGVLMYIFYKIIYRHSPSFWVDPKHLLYLENISHFESLLDISFSAKTRYSPNIHILTHNGTAIVKW